MGFSGGGKEEAGDVVGEVEACCGAEEGDGPEVGF